MYLRPLLHGQALFRETESLIGAHANGGLGRLRNPIKRGAATACQAPGKAQGNSYEHEQKRGAPVSARVNFKELPQLPRQDRAMSRWPGRRPLAYAGLRDQWQRADANAIGFEYNDAALVEVILDRREVRQ